MSHALGYFKTNSDGYRQQLQNYLASLLRYGESQSQLLMATATSLKESESSRALLEKQLSHLWRTTRNLTDQLRGNDDKSYDIATLLEERTALKGEIITLKELAAEVQVENAWLKNLHKRRSVPVRSIFDYCYTAWKQGTKGSKIWKSGKIGGRKRCVAGITKRTNRSGNYVFGQK
ncbi:MAG: hypothetical protein Q9223_007853 [Gallowayella weberi]